MYGVACFHACRVLKQSKNEQNSLAMHFLSDPAMYVAKKSMEMDTWLRDSCYEPEKIEGILYTYLDAFDPEKNQVQEMKRAL